MIRKVTISLFYFFYLTLHINAQIIDTVCPGEKNVKYAVINNQGSTYTWNVVGGIIKSGNGTSEIYVDWLYQTGIYDISVLEKNFLNCNGNQVFASVLINKKFYEVSYPLAACINDSVTLSASKGDKYLWNTGNTSSSIKVKIVHDTTFWVKISENTCNLLVDTFNMKIKAINNPNVAFSPNEQEFYKDKSIYFQYLGDKKDNVVWIFDKSAISKIIANNANITFIDTGQTIIKLTATNIYGCTDSLSKTINIKDENIYMPNAFTPNGDGLNDYFKAIGHGIKSCKMTIYNRWGEEIFVSNSMLEGWNGSYKNEPLSSDVFVYTVQAFGYSGQAYYLKGTVTLLK